MFSSGRFFRLISFHADSVNSLDDIKQLLPENQISESERLSNDDDNFKIAHMFFFSKTKFTQSIDLEECKVIWNDCEQYRYNFYICCFKVGKTSIGLIAVPFTMMAKELFGDMHNAGIGKDIFYQKLELKDLVEAVLKKSHMGGDLKLTRLKWIIHGAPGTNMLSLTGADVPNSKVFKRIYGKLTPGVTFVLNDCLITYNNHEGKMFNMRVDKSGNFTFYVKSITDGINLQWTEDLWLYFYDAKLISETPQLPLRASDKVEPED